MLLVSGFVVDIPNVGLGQESPDIACAFIPLRREVFHENVAFVCGRISMQPLFFPKVDGLDRVTQRDGVRAGFWYVKRHPMAFPYI